MEGSTLARGSKSKCRLDLGRKGLSSGRGVEEDSEKLSVGAGLPEL